MSRIGRKAINIPKEVKVEATSNTVYVEGPKGKASRTFSDRLSFEAKDGQFFVKREANTKLDKALQGLSRTLILNMIKGVTEGYSKELEIIGVGYKVQMQGANLTMQLGFSHPVNIVPPEGVKIETPKPTQIVIKGIDKEKVGELAAEIRAVCPPEPYKGKGIRYADEYVKKKVGKAQATGTK